MIISQTAQDILNMTKEGKTTAQIMKALNVTQNYVYATRSRTKGKKTTTSTPKKRTTNKDYAAKQRKLTAEEFASYLPGVTEGYFGSYEIHGEFTLVPTSTFKQLLRLIDRADPAKLAA